MLADTLGPRRILSIGSLIAACGSLLFALAPAWEVAAVGRTWSASAFSVAFIAILKSPRCGFLPTRFATLNGVTMFAGNLGAVMAGARSRGWSRRPRGAASSSRSRSLSAPLAVATWLVVRDRPQDRGFRR